MAASGTVNRLPGLSIKPWEESYATRMILVQYYCVMSVLHILMQFNSYLFGCDLVLKFIMSLALFKEILFISFALLTKWYLFPVSSFISFFQFCILYSSAPFWEPLKLKSCFWLLP